MADSDLPGNDGPRTEGLDVVLGMLKTCRNDLDRLEFAVVDLLRRNGVTWIEIGDELDISPEAARQRFSHPKSRRRPST